MRQVQNKSKKFWKTFYEDGKTIIHIDLKISEYPSYRVRQTRSSFNTILKDAERENQKFYEMHPDMNRQSGLPQQQPSHDFGFYFVIISLLVCEDLGIIYPQPLGTIMAWFVAREYEVNIFSFATNQEKCITEINRVVRGILWFLTTASHGSIRDLFALTDAIGPTHRQQQSISSIIAINISPYLKNSKMKLADFAKIPENVQNRQTRQDGFFTLPWWVVEEWRIILNSWATQRPPPSHQRVLGLISSDGDRNPNLEAYEIVLDLQTLVGKCFSYSRMEQIDEWATILESHHDSISGMILAFQSSPIFSQNSKHLIGPTWERIQSTMENVNPEAVWRRLHPSAWANPISARIWSVGMVMALILIL